MVCATIQFYRSITSTNKNIIFQKKPSSAAAETTRLLRLKGMWRGVRRSNAALRRQPVVLDSIFVCGRGTKAEAAPVPLPTVALVVIMLGGCLWWLETYTSPAANFHDTFQARVISNSSLLSLRVTITVICLSSCVYILRDNSGITLATRTSPATLERLGPQHHDNQLRLVNLKRSGTATVFISSAVG